MGCINLGFLTVEAALFVVALSLDALVASVAFGAEKIEVPFSSALVIDFVCSGLLGIALFAGSVVQDWVTPEIASVISFLTLLTMGFIRLFDSFVKQLIHKFRTTITNQGGNPAKIDFQLFKLKFILQVYADSVEADANHSKRLSAAEACSLAVALSLDGLAAGFGAGITPVSHWQIVLFSLIFNLAAVLGGCKIGRCLAKKTEKDISWVSGAVLIILGTMKLFQN